MKSPNDAQGLLISKIKSTLPANISLADELADLLQVSSDSAYRRIRGETALTIDEITRICSHFKISFDALVSQDEGFVSFTYHEVNNYADFIRYLNGIKDDMIRISRAPEKHIIYAAVDMPVFHYFAFPEYFYFKMFYWLRSVATDPEYQAKKYCISDLSAEMISLCRELADLYASVPSIEIWPDSILNSIIKQITYYWQSGVFCSKEDAFSLITAIRKTLERAHHESETNMKLMSDGGTHNFERNYQLYQSDIEIGNNFILVSVGHAKILYNSFHTFNKMFTTNPPFCELTERWMNNLIKQSNLISGVAEKYRFQFFQKEYAKLDALHSLIEKGG
jgi:hypothetical protein